MASIAAIMRTSKRGEEQVVVSFLKARLCWLRPWCGRVTGYLAPRLATALSSQNCRAAIQQRFHRESRTQHRSCPLRISAPVPEDARW